MPCQPINACDLWQGHPLAGIKLRKFPARVRLPPERRPRTAAAPSDNEGKLLSPSRRIAREGAVRCAAVTNLDCEIVCNGATGEERGVDSRVAAPQIDPQIASSSEMARASSLSASAESSSGRFWMASKSVLLAVAVVVVLWLWKEKDQKRQAQTPGPKHIHGWLFAVRARAKLPEVKPAISRLKLEIEVHDTSGKSKRPPLPTTLVGTLYLLEFARVSCRRFLRQPSSVLRRRWVMMSNTQSRGQ